MKNLKDLKDWKYNFYKDEWWMFSTPRWIISKSKSTVKKLNIDVDNFMYMWKMSKEDIIRHIELRFNEWSFADCFSKHINDWMNEKNFLIFIESRYLFHLKFLLVVSNWLNS